MQKLKQFRAHLPTDIFSMRLKTLIRVSIVVCIHVQLGQTDFSQHQKEYLSIFEPDHDVVRNQFVINIFQPQVDEINSFCKPKDFFWSFNARHNKAKLLAEKLFDEAFGISSPYLFLVAKELKYKINPRVWYAALHRVLFKHRIDISVVSPAEVFPSSFIPETLIRRAFHDSTTDDKADCITFDGSAGKDNGPENLLWYFREDIMNNVQHWTWHVRNIGRIPLWKIVLSRYNAERLANGLPLTLPYSVSNLEPLRDGYNSHLLDFNSELPFLPRKENYTVKGTEAHFYSQEQGRTKFLNAVEHLSKQTGLYGTAYDYDDDLIKAVDQYLKAANYSKGINGYHIEAHSLIAQMGQGPSVGVIGDGITVVRDPAYYRLHTHLNEMVNVFKDKVTPYEPCSGDHHLQFSGIEISGVSVTSGNLEADNLATFWNTKSLDLSRAIDLAELTSPGRQAPRSICVKHLDHEQFEYHINIQNYHKEIREATIRIFLAPRHKLDGSRFSMDEQRHQFFPLDVFKATLRPGENSLIRKSVDSTIIREWIDTFTELNNGKPTPYCGCGWPQHLLLPKGKESGMMFDLVAMATEATNDEFRPFIFTESESRCIYACDDGFEKTFPDAKPTGYPFDRVPYNVELPNGQTRQVSNLEEYMDGISSMSATIVKITHFP